MAADWDRSKQTYFILRRGNPWCVMSADCKRRVCAYPANYECGEETGREICFAVNDDAVRAVVDAMKDQQNIRGSAMGITQHKAVVATTWSDQKFRAIKVWVDGLKPGGAHFDPRRLFMFGESVTNCYHTVVMLPDGHHEGWPGAVACDAVRAEFIALMTAYANDDGSNSWRWVEVEYGERGQKLRGGNNTDLVGDAA